MPKSGQSKRQGIYNIKDSKFIDTVDIRDGLFGKWILHVQDIWHQIKHPDKITHLGKWRVHEHMILQSHCYDILKIPE